MPPYLKNMINLLPKDEKEKLEKEQKQRFWVLALSLFSATLFLGFVMLWPAYFLAGDFFDDGLDSTSLKPEDAISNEKIQNLPLEIKSKLALFRPNTAVLSPADYFFEIAENLPAGVVVNSISFRLSQNYKNKTGQVISISGLAASRELLISFAERLQKIKLFSEVEIPVSNLTKDKNLPFSINIFIE